MTGRLADRNLWNHKNRSVTKESDKPRLRTCFSLFFCRYDFFTKLQMMNLWFDLGNTPPGKQTKRLAPLNMALPAKRIFRTWEPSFSGSMLGTWGGGIRWLVGGWTNPFEKISVNLAQKVENKPRKIQDASQTQKVPPHFSRNSLR